MLPLEDREMLKEMGIKLEETNENITGITGDKLYKVFHYGEEIGVMAVKKDGFYSLYVHDEETYEGKYYTGNKKMKEIVEEIK